MDAKAVKKYRALLESRQEELRRLVTQTQQEGRGIRTEETKDEGDRANASESKELAHARNAQARRTLLEIEAALRRINDGSFGECMNCGQEIGGKRLEAVPWVRCCITCQELIESTR
jgi:DnaK suppressor protein